MPRTFQAPITMPVIAREDDFGSVQESFDVPLGNARVHDAIQTNLPGTSATDDLALLGTDYAYLGTGDVMNSSVTRYARLTDVIIPYSYVDGETLDVLVWASAQVATVSATVDCECFLQDGTGTASSDLCTTAATTCNSATAAAKTFNITAASLAGGCRLNLRLALIVNDTGGGDACVAKITRVQIRCNTKG